MAERIVPLYADLIDGIDADGQQLVADLHAFFNPAVPSQLQAAPPLVAPRAVGPTWRWRWHWPRAALVTTLAIFALVGATYIVPLLQSLWSQDRGLQHVNEAGLVRELDLRQTINGVTVHLQKGYADVNRVAIGYSVEFPPTTPGDRSFAMSTLTDDQGNTYRTISSSTTGNSPLGAEVHNFEPLGVTGGRDIAFTLTIPEVMAFPSVDQAARGNVTTQSFQGPWVFTFSLPMAAGRVIEPDLVFTRSGVELTFTRIVVTPSATRFDYRVHLDGFTDRASASLVLHITGRGPRLYDPGLDVVQVFTAGDPTGRWSSFAPACRPEEECFYIATEPLLDANTLEADAVIFIPDREPCPPRQHCVVARDGKPFQVEFGTLVVPLR